MKKQMKHRTADEHRVWGRVVDAAFLGHQAFRLNIMKVSGWQRLLATGMGTWGNLSTLYRPGERAPFFLEAEGWKRRLLESLPASHLWI